MVSQVSAAAHQEAVDAGGVDQRNDGGVFDPADAPPLEVEHRHGQQFREVEKVFRHRNTSQRQTDASAPDGTETRWSFGCALHGFLTPIPIWRIGLQGRNKKVEGKALGPNEREWTRTKKAHVGREAGWKSVAAAGGFGESIAARRPAASDLSQIYKEARSPAICSSLLRLFRSQLSVSVGRQSNAIRDGPQVLSVRTEDLSPSAMTLGWSLLGRSRAEVKVSTTAGATYPGQDKNCWRCAVVSATLYLVRN